jgi:hypothetical protein
MPIMPLNGLNTVPDAITDGHVINDEVKKELVVMTTEDSPNMIKIAENIEDINRVANSLVAIENANKHINEISRVIDLANEINEILKAKENISKLSTISNELDTLAKNMPSILELTNDIDTVIKVGNNQDEYHLLWDIREHIVNLNESKDKLLELLANMKNIDINANNIDDINLVAIHMLAVEIVAQNIDLLRWFNLNIDKVESIIEIHPDIQKFIQYIDIAQELVSVVNGLPETLEKFKADMDALATDMTEKFKTLADERLKQMKDAFDDFMRESLKIRSSIMDLDKALMDFKLKVMEDNTTLKEAISKFKEDLVIIQDQLQAEICKVEKRFFKELAKLRLDFETNIEIIKKDNAEFKLSINTLLQDQEDKDKLVLKELEDSLTVKIENNTELISNLKDNVNSIKDNLEDKIDNVKDSFENKLDNLKEYTETRLDDLSKDTDTRLDTLKDDTEIRLDDLHKEIDEYKNSITQSINDLKLDTSDFKIEVNNQIIDIKEQILEKLLEEGTGGLDLNTLIAGLESRVNASMVALETRLEQRFKDLEDRLNNIDIPDKANWEILNIRI